MGPHAQVVLSGEPQKLVLHAWHVIRDVLNQLVDGSVTCSNFTIIAIHDFANFRDIILALNEVFEGNVPLLDGPRDRFPDFLQKLLELRKCEVDACQKMYWHVTKFANNCKLNGLKISKWTPFKVNINTMLGYFCFQLTNTISTETCIK